MRPAQKQSEQDRDAQAGRQCSDPAQLAQTAEGSGGDQRQQRADDHRRLAPETFLQRQTHGRASAPAGQQIGHRPAGGCAQADQQKTPERHVEHAGGHRQHRPQRADEATDQQAGNAVALEVMLGT